MALSTGISNSVRRRYFHLHFEFARVASLACHGRKGGRGTGGFGGS